MATADHWPGSRTRAASGSCLLRGRLQGAAPPSCQRRWPRPSISTTSIERFTPAWARCTRTGSQPGPVPTPGSGPRAGGGSLLRPGCPERSAGPRRSRGGRWGGVVEVAGPERQPDGGQHDHGDHRRDPVAAAGSGTRRLAGRGGARRRHRLAGYRSAAGAARGPGRDGRSAPPARLAAASAPLPGRMGAGGNHADRRRTGPAAGRSQRTDRADPPGRPGRRRGPGAGERRRRIRRGRGPVAGFVQLVRRQQHHPAGRRRAASSRSASTGSPRCSAESTRTWTSRPARPWAGAATPRLVAPGWPRAASEAPGDPGPPLSGGRDLNPRPPDPQSGALPNCATARWATDPSTSLGGPAGAQMCFGSHSASQ